jgi:serine/threonine-protein kinase
MSPEQAGGDAVDGRSDLYALGAVGYFALTGQPPFVAPSTQAVLAQQITKAAPPVSALAHGVPSALGRAIDRLLEKKSGRALRDR